ncbi:alpha/beta hydrolase [Actinophytocola sp.]|uniref:alpha/beta hydrolase n=1 Tax=Actinophytocola sp. TaxID=1872138 RepID=UPI002D81116A|nr:alpha/beta hydrolase-fold protein [Actinophytocola sp.]HET9143257.1 alpha/beta hydrolase-fold protein [Actinophytocola sp.]
MAEPRALPVAAGPQVGAREIVFSLSDPDRRLAGVRLAHELDLPGADVEFRFDGGLWQLCLPRPPVWRMEYKLALRHPDGGTEDITDPGNPLTAPGAFGAKSVLRMPEYVAPAWLDGAPDWDVTAELSVTTGVGQVDVLVRSPAEPTTKLLVAHDGPEFAHLAGLGRFAATMVAGGRLPPFHLALAAPGARDERYSANPGYAAALGRLVLPALHAELGGAGPVVLMGASLGGLAALHAQRRHPAAISGLFLQSASFFMPQYDECEQSYRYYPRITRYVAGVLRARRTPRSIPITLTCGVAEENLHNNRMMATNLRRLNYAAELHEVPDAHNYVAWRDAFDPHLVDLLRKAWVDA